MTAGLRKAHKIIWLILAAVIPVLMFLSIQHLRFDTPQSDMLSTTHTQNTPPISEAENDMIKAQLYASELVLIVKTPLKTASTIVKSISKNQKTTVLGQVSTVGIYKFNIQDDIQEIQLIDKIKDKDITKLNF